MFPAVVSTVPEWVISGIQLGLLASLAVAVLFYVMVRYFPSERPAGERIDSETRRRTEIREYLDAIDEQYREDHAVDGQAVAFYLPGRDVAITFDARVYYQLAGSETDTVLVEHELPGGALGYRLPFETPEIDREIDQPRPQVAAHAVLGLPAEATVEEIDGAYREKVKEVHPDHGGTQAEFRRVQDAYTTAKEHAN